MLAVLLAAPQPRSALVAAAGGTPESGTPILSTPAPTVTAIAPTPETAPTRHYVVMLVLDGFRTSYFHLAKTPHISALERNGTVYDNAWVGQMESSTPGVHVTFGTGTLPKENGFLGFAWANPATRQIIDFRTLLANRQIDPVLRSLPVPSITERLHQYMPKAISVVGSGHKDYAAVGLGGGYADYELYGKYVNKQFIPTYMHSPPPLTAAERKSLTLPQPLKMGAEDNFAFRYASIVASHVAPKLLMLNLPEMDTYGHWDGPASHAVFKKLLENIDNGLGLLEKTYANLGILDRTDWIITADHGMMESKPVHNWKNIQNAMISVGAKPARADGSDGAVWLENPAQAKIAADKVVSLHPGHVEAVFYRSGLGTNYHFVLDSPTGWLVRPAVADALQSMVDTTAGIHGPDLWILYRENYTATSRNVFGTWKGTHGGATWKVQHVPLIISGPDVKKGYHSSFPARAIDVTPTIERLLGLPAIKRDGVILADSFTKPLPGEAGPENAIALSLKSDVSALQDQSAADDKTTPSSLFKDPPYNCAKARVGDPHCYSTAASASNF